MFGKILTFADNIIRKPKSQMLFLLAIMTSNDTNFKIIMFFISFKFYFYKILLWHTLHKFLFIYTLYCSMALNHP